MSVPIPALIFFWQVPEKALCNTARIPYCQEAYSSNNHTFSMHEGITADCMLPAYSESESAGYELLHQLPIICRLSLPKLLQQVCQIHTGTDAGISPKIFHLIVCFFSNINYLFLLHNFFGILSSYMNI